MTEEIKSTATFQIVDVIERARKARKITMTRMAKVMGYERSAYHRMVKNSQTKGNNFFEGVVNAARELEIPLEFLFTDFDETSPVGIALLSQDQPCSLMSNPDWAPMTKQIADEVSPRSAIQKQALLEVVKDDSTMEIVEILAKAGPEKRQNILAALRRMTDA